MVSLGCAKNTVDTERVLGMLAERGFVISADPGLADVVLVNTCAFIAPAREETESTLGELARDRPVVAIGCYPKRFGRRKLPGVAASVPFEAYDDLPAICERLAGRKCPLGPQSSKTLRSRTASPRPLGQAGPSREPDLRRPKSAERAVARSRSKSSECFDRSPRLRIGSPATAYLKIAEGCSNRCSYCAVPAIRGELRSVPIEKLLDEAEGLVDIGARELCVIAQDTASYGLDLYGKPRTHELLRKLCEVRKLRWVRLMYVHPAHLTDEILEVVAGERKVCSYLDLPVQHASSRMLGRMGRFHDGPFLRGLLERIRARVPGVALRTSVIVGFPGEGQLEFRELLDFVREAAFDHLGAFCYSRESGTRSARLGGRVAAATARARRDKIMRAQQRVAFEKLDARVGGTETAMLELPTRERGMWLARTRREAPEVDGTVLVKGAPRDAAPGRFVRVRIEARSGYDLVARFSRRQRNKQGYPG
jgi:ribosomal protein S12 methylthiotransferase